MTGGVPWPFEDDHEAFRESVAAFLDGEVVPSWGEWTSGTGVPGLLYARAAAQGIGGIAVPEEHGGAGVDDPRFEAVVAQECARRGLTGLGVLLSEHAEAARWLARHGTDELRERWLPALATGERRATVAVGASVAGTGDGLELIDVAGGAGASVMVADLGDGGPGGVAVVDLTDESVTCRPAGALGAAGVGSADVKVPCLDGAAVVVAAGGPELRAMCRRAWAVLGAAGARTAFDLTVAYVNDRHVFSTPVAAFGNTRTELAGLAAELAGTDALVAGVLAAGDGPGSYAALALLRAVASHDAAVDLGLQLHGGYGYMLEYPISSAFADARYLRLHSGLDALVADIAPQLGLVAPVAARS